MNLNLDCIINILNYDDRFIIKNGKISNFNKISKMDIRYKIISTIPMKQFNKTGLYFYVYLTIDFGLKFFKLYYNLNFNKIMLETLQESGFKFANILLDLKSVVL